MSADHDPPPLTQAHAWVRASPASLPEARGTLCAVLASLTLPRRYYGLSAGHVLGGHSTAAEGEATVLEQAWPPLQLQGRLARWSPRFHSHQASGPIDAGLMELSAQAVEDLAHWLVSQGRSEEARAELAAALQRYESIGAAGRVSRLVSWSAEHLAHAKA